MGSNPAPLVVTLFHFFKLFSSSFSTYKNIINELNHFLSNYWNLKSSFLFPKPFENENNINYNYYNRIFYKNKFYNFFQKKFIILDFFFFFIFSIKFFKKNNLVSYRNNYRLLNSKQGFYFNFSKNKAHVYTNIIYFFCSGFKFIWLGLRYWILPLIVSFTMIYSSLVLKILPFNKIMFTWIGIIMLLYWLISGFVFFFKKYQFGKYTSVIQRFWRRSYILFWLIEGGLFGVFLFLTINAAQESFYMFDQINIFKTHLYSWRFFFLKIFPIVILLLFSYLLIISVKWNIFSKYSIILLTLTFLLTYLVWLEFYQFFHVVNFYSQFNWIYDIDEHIWSLEQEPRKTRTVNHYIMLMFILKFWHVVFIYGFWIFFVLRCWETKKITYPLLAANFQNFIILYIFAWVFMYPWFKFFFRKFLDNPYYWFYVNNRKMFFRVIFYDIKLIFFGIFIKIQNIGVLEKFHNFEFFYWNMLNQSVNYESYRKHIIRDRIFKTLWKK